MSEKEIQLPDGVGLSLEDVRVLLARKHETVLGADDPVMMLVTLHNAFLGEYEKMLARHNAAITALLTEKTDGYVASVRSSAEGLAKDFSTTSVENVRQTFREHDVRLQVFRHNLMWLAAIVGISALANVVVFVLRGGQ